MTLNQILVRNNVSQRHHISYIKLFVLRTCLCHHSRNSREMYNLIFIIDISMYSNLSTITQYGFICYNSLTCHINSIKLKCNVNCTICCFRCKINRCNSTFDLLTCLLINKNATHSIFLTNSKVLIFNSVDQSDFTLCLSLM